MIFPTKLKSTWLLGAVALLMAASTLPKKARGALTSPFDVNQPTSREVDRLLNGHPICGPLLLYSIVASAHPELLLENLETASMMADSLTIDINNYSQMVAAFRVIALHLSEHEDSQFQTVEYWRRACDDIERCSKQVVPSPACFDAGSAVENFND
jgi:hypothetical protein